LFASKIEVKPRPHPACVLAIGAHPDDIEIAAGAALAKMRDAGYGITGLIMTRGERGGDGHTRPVEAERGAKFLGLDSVKVLDFNDTHLSEDIVKITGVIEAMIDKIQPAIIFTHSAHDLHQDHQTVYEATMGAARNTCTTILCYESPSVTQDFHPTYYIDVEKYVDVKVQAMREHYDQRKKSYMKPDLVRGKMAFRGAQAKVDYAEGFEVARMVSSI
jgi:LmbE family N-acetylglucosaminyl deacetylase